MKLPLDKKPYYNTDSVAESMATDDMMDCYLEPVPGEGLVTRRRPGLTQFCDLLTGAPGDGIYDWENADKVIVASGGRVFSLSEDGTFTEITPLGENESPPYTGANYVNWNLGTGWQKPIKNQSDDDTPIKYKTLMSMYNATTRETTYPFENGALAKNADGTGIATPSSPNTTVKGVVYKVEIYPHVYSGSASYTLGGTTGTSITGTTKITDYLSTSTTEGLIITPTDTSRMVLTISWKAKGATRDMLDLSGPVVFDDGQDLMVNPWLYMANGKLIYIKDED